MDSAVCVRTGDEVVQGFSGESSGSRKLEGVYEGGIGETGAPLRGISYIGIWKRKKF